MLSAVKTSIPASSSSSITSCQRFGWREPGTLLCASSSISATCGLRARSASRSSSSRSGRDSRSACAAALRGPADQRFGVGAAMGLDQLRRRHPRLPSARAARVLQHGVGLADTGRGAEEDLQPAPLLALGVVRGGKSGEWAGGVSGISYGERIQREVEGEDIHPGLAQYTKVGAKSISGQSSCSMGCAVEAPRAARGTRATWASAPARERSGSSPGRTP